MADDRIEAVKKISEALKDKGMNGTEEMAQREHFQNLIDTTSSLKTQPNFQVVDNSSIPTEGVQKLEDNPVFADNNVQVQKSGTATDDQGSRGGKRQGADEDEKIVSGVTSKGKTSLFDEVKNLHTQVGSIAKLGPEDLRSQSKSLIAQIDTVKTKLSESQHTDIKSSYQTLLRNRLTHIDDNLKIALSKAGVEYTPTASVKEGMASNNPIKRFLGFLTHSQYQLEHLNETIEALNGKNATLTPANMLALQVKMGYVQQQIELFTSLLNKALESTKTIMNVQV